MPSVHIEKTQLKEPLCFQVGTTRNYNKDAVGTNIIIETIFYTRGEIKIEAEIEGSVHYSAS